MEWILVKTLLSLAGVLGLMFLVVFALKRFVFQGRANGAPGIDIEVLGQRSLQPKRSVVVLKVMNKIIVVGMSDQGMQTLTEINDERSLAEAEEQLFSAQAGGGWHNQTRERIRRGARSFADLFQNYVQLLVTKNGRRVHVRGRERVDN
jgi:flagellar protein FliO/FliZ